MKTILLLLVTFMLIGCNHNDVATEDVTIELHYVTGEVLVDTFTVHEGSKFLIENYYGGYRLISVCPEMRGQGVETSIPGVIIFRVLERRKS